MVNVRDSVEGALVRGILGVTWDHVPATAVVATKWFLLDTLGVAVAARNAPGCETVMRQVRGWGGRPESTLWRDGARVPAPQAALGNSVLAHALDLDDTHVGAGLHANAVVLPAALATAEQVGVVSGGDLLCALAVGVDVACRLGLAARDGMHLGWLPTTVCGIFGATAAAGKLLGLDEAELTSALGIAYTLASGNRQSMLEGALTKRLLPGFASRDAVISAYLAKQRITGPSKFLTGGHGLFALYGGNAFDEQVLIEGLGERFYGVDLLRKLYPCCSGAQGVIEAAAALPQAGVVGLEEIAGIRVYVPEEVAVLLGRPFGFGLHPQVDAQFNLGYLVALTILEGGVTLDNIEPDAILANQEVISLARLVEVIPRRVDHGRNAELPATVEVDFKNGRTDSNTVECLGGFSPDDGWVRTVEEKFVTCVRYAAPGVSLETIDAALAVVLHLEELENVDCLTEVIVSLNLSSPNSGSLEV